VQKILKLFLICAFFGEQIAEASIADGRIKEFLTAEMVRQSIVSSFPALAECVVEELSSEKAIIFSVSVKASKKNGVYYATMVSAMTSDQGKVAAMREDENFRSIWSEVPDTERYVEKDGVSIDRGKPPSERKHTTGWELISSIKMVFQNLFFTTSDGKFDILLFSSEGLEAEEKSNVAYYNLAEPAIFIERSYSKSNLKAQPDASGQRR